MSTSDDPRPPPPGRVGLVCALPAELGSLAARVTRRVTRHGCERLETRLADTEVAMIVSGVGKVAAARAGALLLASGAETLLTVGTCGGLVRSLELGALVHCSTAFQADFAVREGRSVEPDAALLAAWQHVAPGPSGWFLTADRPVLSPWRRMRLARAFAGTCVADMETAAVAAVAQAAGVPWAALRAVTDGAGFGGGVAFRRNFPIQAPRAADTVEDLLAHRIEPRIGP
ncbi:MAG: hypothetical protein GY711_16330 [bacterium]|nr:hypothetical protein [bacterium]